MKTGVQSIYNHLKRQDSGLAVIPDLDPGRNNEKWCLSTFYDRQKFLDKPVARDYRKYYWHMLIIVHYDIGYIQQGS